MTSSMEKLHSCIPYTVQPRNSGAEKSATTCNPSATASLKSLAAKVLQRNHRRNSCATNEKMRCNFDERADTLILIDEMKEFLGDDWVDYKENLEALKLWTEAMQNSKLIEQGIAPPSFNGVTNCAHCGLVPVPESIASGGNVLGCMWCFNRALGLPIPTVMKGIKKL
jgi:hypothetical protein